MKHPASGGWCGGVRENRRKILKNHSCASVVPLLFHCSLYRFSLASPHGIVLDSSCEKILKFGSIQYVFPGDLHFFPRTVVTRVVLGAPTMKTKYNPARVLSRREWGLRFRVKYKAREVQNINENEWKFCYCNSQKG